MLAISSIAFVIWDIPSIIREVPALDSLVIAVTSSMEAVIVAMACAMVLEEVEISLEISTTKFASFYMLSLLPPA